MHKELNPQCPYSVTHQEDFLIGKTLTRCSSTKTASDNEILNLVTGRLIILSSSNGSSIFPQALKNGIIFLTAKKNRNDGRTSEEKKKKNYQKNQRSGIGTFRKSRYGCKCGGCYSEHGIAAIPGLMEIIASAKSKIFYSHWPWQFTGAIFYIIL